MPKHGPKEALKTPRNVQIAENQRQRRNLEKSQSGEKKQLTHSGTRIKMTSEFASATMHTEEEQSEIFSV